MPKSKSSKLWLIIPLLFLVFLLSLVVLGLANAFSENQFIDYWAKKLSFPALVCYMITIIPMIGTSSKWLKHIGR